MAFGRSGMPAASTAEVQAGTATGKAVTPASLKAALGISKFYESAEQTITAGGTATLSHGLGAKPKDVFLVLVCKTAELGYAVNEEVPSTFYHEYTSSSVMHGVGIGSDTTNLNCKVSAFSQPFGVINRTTGNLSLCTNANWRWKIYANG